VQRVAQKYLTERTRTVAYTFTPPPDAAQQGGAK